MTDRTLTIRKAAKKLGVVKETLYRWLKTDPNLKDCFEIIPILHKKTIKGKEYRLSLKDVKKIGLVRGYKIREDS